MMPADVLKEIKRQFDWRTPDGRPRSHIVITREQAEALLRTPELINQAIDDGIHEFIDAIAKAGEVTAFLDAVAKAKGE
jgi:hypothetical protein